MGFCDNGIKLVITDIEQAIQYWQWVICNVIVTLVIVFLFLYSFVFLLFICFIYVCDIYVFNLNFDRCILIISRITHVELY